MPEHTSREVVRAVAAIVQYNWADEKTDYWYNCSDDPDDNQRSGHIFESLRLVQRWLETYGYPYRQAIVRPDPKKGD